MRALLPRVFTVFAPITKQRDTRPGPTLEKRLEYDLRWLEEHYTPRYDGERHGEALVTSLT